MHKARTLKIIGAVVIMAAVLVGIPIFPRPVMAPKPEETPTSALTEAVEEAERSLTVRAAYVPDPEELQEIPAVSTLELAEGYIVSSQQEGILKVSWPAVPDADYYVLCVLDASNAIVQTDILKMEITEWEFPDFQGTSVMLLCYKDMGEDGAQDDKLTSAYVDNMAPAATPQPTSSKPKNKYMIIIDKEDNAFAAFTYDKNGEYTAKVAEFPCALGRSSRMTPIGTFKISNKGRWKAWRSDDFSPYYTSYTSGLYFHGPIYRKKDGSTLIPKSYNEIGTNASSGCVRTTTAGAYWVYTYCPAGTVVKIVKTAFSFHGQASLRSTPTLRPGTRRTRTSPKRPNLRPPQQ